MLDVYLGVEYTIIGGRCMGKVVKFKDYFKGNKKTVEGAEIKASRFGMSEDCYCVVCGTYVPEGSQVCPSCKKKYNLEG